MRVRFQSLWIRSPKIFKILLILGIPTGINWVAWLCHVEVVRNYGRITIFIGVMIAVWVHGIIDSSAMSSEEAAEDVRRRRVGRKRGRHAD